MSNNRPATIEAQKLQEKPLTFDPHLAVLDPEKKPFERLIFPKDGTPQKFKFG